MQSRELTEIFDQNIEAWSVTHPQKALILPYLKGLKNVLYKTTHGEWTLRNRQKATGTSLDPMEGAVNEAHAWVKALKLRGVKALFIYGVGLGYHYEALRKWLKANPQRKLVILEDDLETIYHLFHTPMGRDLLCDKQVRLFHFKDMEECQEILLGLHWEFVNQKIHVAAIRIYEATKTELYAQLKHRIVHDALVKNALIDEYLKYGVGFFKNFYPNLLELSSSILGNRLFGKFTKIPAIICGAGPSLNKNIDVLKTLKDRALIFAGGSALNALHSAGLDPHFGAAIDPNSTEYERISRLDMPELPIFYRGRLLHKALKAIKGPRLYITGSGGYDVSEWFENTLGIEREPVLDEGHNVLNFCLEIAQAMGCDPIIFVGMDLAYTGMKSYADGIVTNTSLKRSEIIKAKNFDDSAILKKDIYGKPLYTLWKWVAESEWISEFVEKHSGTRIINATEGGLGFKGVPNYTLRQVAAKWLKVRHSLAPKVYSELQKSSLANITKAKIQEVLDDFRESIVRAFKNICALIDEINALEVKVKGLKKVPKGFNLLSGRAALLEMDLNTEPAYKYLLELFDEVYMRMIHHDMQRLRYSRSSEKHKILKKLTLNRQRLVFLKSVSEVNLELICMTRDGEFS